MAHRPEPTLNSGLSAAELCRRNGWGSGTRLAGDEGYGVTVIVITAVGERSILARSVSHAGKPTNRSENQWVLFCRDWTVAGADA